MAIVALVLAVISIFFSWCIIVAGAWIITLPIVFVFAPIPIASGILGIIALKKKRNKLMSVIGMIGGIIGIAVSIIITIDRILHY